MQWAVPVREEQEQVAHAMEAVFNNKDLLKSIFEQLDLHEICIAATTCQLWNQVANHDDFWKQIDFRGKQVLPINAAALLQRHPRVEQLDLSALQGPAQQGGADGTVGFVQQIAPHLTRLQRLTFASTAKAPSAYPLWCIPEQLVQHASMFAALTCLTLTGARMSHAVTDLAHPTLRRLVLDETDAPNLDIKCPALTCLSMADSPAKRMPNLEEAPALLALDLSRCLKLQEISARSTIMRLTALQELSMGGLANILDQTLIVLSASLGQLTKLEMPKAAGVTFQGVMGGFPSLRRLDLSRCDQLNPAALPAALESFECLESVSLDNCTLTTLKLSMSQLKDLSVCGCQGLTELEVQAWQLSRLDLGPTPCPRSCNRNLSKLTVTSGALKRMEWAELHKLGHVELDCPALTELLVRDCDFPDATVLQSLGDTAVPPLLASDVLSKACPGAAAGLQRAPLASGSGSGAASAQLGGAGGGAGAGAAGAAAGQQGPAGGAWGVPVVDAFDFGLDGLLGDDDNEGQQPRGDDPDEDDGGDSDQGGGHGGGGGHAGRAPLRRLLSREGGGAQAATSMHEADAAWVERRYGSWLGRDRRRGAPDRASIFFAMPAESAMGAGDAGASSFSAAAAAVAGGAGPSRLAGAGPSNIGRRGSAGAGSSQTAAAAAAGGNPSNQGVSSGVSDVLCMGADAAGAGSSGQHSSPQHEQPSQTHQQQQRRRQRRGGAGSTRVRQQQARLRMAVHCWLGSQSPRSVGAAADADEGRWLEQEDEPMCVATTAGTPSAQGAGPSSSQQQQASQGAGPRQLQLNLPAACRPASHRLAAVGGGGGGDGDSSGGSDADSDIDIGGAAAGGSMGAALPRQRSSSSSSNRVAAGKGGVPRLRVLHVEGCDRLQELQLSHAALQEVSVSGCNSMVVIALHAPKLSSLELQELGDLKGACLQEVAVSSLTMGSCSTLQGMELSSSQLVLLDVRGCGGLQQLHLNCPALQVLDATFCGSLADEGLASAVANIPPLRQLALSVCCQISSTGLSALSKLTGLQELDLSYTEVSTLQPILDSCPRLRSLSIASCRGLSQDALLPLLDAQQPPLSQLTALDASYCDVQDVLAAQLLLRCRQLQHLALSGCAGVTDAIWQQVESQQLQQAQSHGVAGAAAAAVPAGEATAVMDLDEAVDFGDGCEGSGAGELGPADGDAGSSGGSSQLESLSLVRCNNLRSLCLGLLPASGSVELLPAKHYLLSGGRAALQQAAPQCEWVEVPSAVSQLTSLKAGLSGVQVVALALPKLAHLDLSSCKHLRVLELRCPLLLQLQLQACTALPVVSAVRGVLGAPRLQMLDVQHMLGAAGPADQDGGAEALDAVVARHSNLKPGSILRCTSVCKVCHKLAEHCSLG